MSSSIVKIKQELEEIGEGKCQGCEKPLAWFSDDQVFLEEGLCKFCYCESLLLLA